MGKIQFMVGTKRLRACAAPALKEAILLYGARKVPNMVKTKQALILCRRDEYGITNLNRRAMIKYTYLYRELMLCLDARKITETYYYLEEKGMFSWEAYKEHKDSIQKSFETLRNALARYKYRRIKAGHFYMCTHRSLHLVFVMSPLYTMPRKEALTKIRQIIEKREAYDPTSNKTIIGTPALNLNRGIGRVLKNIGGCILIQVWWLNLFAAVIACIIVHYD